jgi:hypothetical protein
MTGMGSSWRCGSVSSKRNNATSPMIGTTGTWSSHQASGCVCALFIGLSPHWSRRARGSLVRSFMGHSSGCGCALCIGDVAYRLQLSTGAKLHDVFHVGQLKLYHDKEPAGPGVMPTIRHGHAWLEPSNVIKSCLPCGHHELLVQWVGLNAADAAWVDLDEFRRLYPAF